MGPRDQIRPDRSRPFRSVPAPVDEPDDELWRVPDLRAKNPLRRPLSKTVKEAATLIGALVAIGGYALGGGRWLIRNAGIAKTADIVAAVVPLSDSIRTSDTQRAAQYKTLVDTAEAIKAEQRTQAATLQSIQRALRKLRPAAAKDIP